MDMRSNLQGDFLFYICVVLCTAKGVLRATNALRTLNHVKNSRAGLLTLIFMLLWYPSTLPYGTKLAWIAGGSAKIRPLQVISNKSCYGHTEGAAGLTGVLLAQCASFQRGVPPVMHLRSWNPHVAAALDTWRSQSKLSAAVPTQAAGDFSFCAESSFLRISFQANILPWINLRTLHVHMAGVTGIHAGSTPIIATRAGAFCFPLVPAGIYCYTVDI